MGTLKPGDTVTVPFGPRRDEGTVIYVGPTAVHVAVDLPGSDEPVVRLYRLSEVTKVRPMTRASWRTNENRR